ncbi:MAG: DUF4129 domain-containing protein [Actinobacteria bacterium]|nr:DUF4129 domain-containing protein [Actinomycetota bacterium]
MVRDATRLRALPLPGALGAVVVIAGLLMAIASLQGVPQFGDIAILHRGPAPTPAAGTQPPGSSRMDQIPDSPVLATIATAIAILLCLAFLVLMAWLFWRVVRALWAQRPLSRQTGGGVEIGEAVAGDEPVDAGAIRAATAGAQDVMDAHRDPGDAIVAAWVHLEEASARAGRARSPSETPAEFTVGILRGRPGLDDDLETLLGLYESVRFGGEAADEAERRTARRCLAAIEERWR